MKKFISLISVVGLLSIGLAFTSYGAEKSSAGGSANLIVKRSANFGGITTVTVSVDGKKMGTIPRGQVYRGKLTPGEHVIKAEIQPNYQNSKPSEKTITAEAGKTYSFTATWKADAMVLVQH